MKKSTAVLTFLFVLGLPSAAAPQTTEIVSVNSAGAQANESSFRPSISADGRYVAYFSRSTNLFDIDGDGTIDPDINGNFVDVFVHGREGIQPTATALTEALVQTVFGLNLDEGIFNRLDAKLDAALSALDDLNAHNDVAAVNSLNAYKNHVAANPQSPRSLNTERCPRKRWSASSRIIRGGLKPMIRTAVRTNSREPRSMCSTRCQVLTD